MLALVIRLPPSTFRRLACREHPLRYEHASPLLRPIEPLGTVAARIRTFAMAEHEPSKGGSDDWYTPPEIFAALGLMFDLDPASPGPEHWVPAR